MAYTPFMTAAERKEHTIRHLNKLLEIVESQGVSHFEFNANRDADYSNIDIDTGYAEIKPSQHIDYSLKITVFDGT
jgi:hypothetical protein